MEEIKAINSEIYLNSLDVSDFCNSIIDIFVVSLASNKVTQFTLETFDFLGTSVCFDYQINSKSKILLNKTGKIQKFTNESISINNNNAQSILIIKNFYNESIPFKISLSATGIDQKRAVEAIKLVKRELVSFFKLKFLELKHMFIEIIDDIVDQECDGLSGCENKVLAQTSVVCNNTDIFLTDVFKSDGTRVVFSSDKVQSLFENNESIKKLIHKASQSSKKEKKQILLQRDIHQTLFENSSYNWVYAQPLITSNNDYAGTLIAASKKEYNPKITELVSSAGRLLDTSIVNVKRTSFIVKRLKKHIGSANLNKLMENPSLLDAVKRDVVLLSADIADSTKFSSFQTDPYYAFSLINKYLCMIAEIVMDEFGGTLDKYIGDEVMAIFGAPFVEEDYIERAANCAIKIRNEVGLYNKKMFSNGEEFLNVKISLGLAKQVIAGEVGNNKTQTDYTVIGDDVNRFFRMAKFSVPGEIVINKALKEKLGQNYKTVFNKEVTFKGIENPQKIYFLQDITGVF